MIWRNGFQNSYKCHKYRMYKIIYTLIYSILGFVYQIVWNVTDIQSDMVGCVYVAN